MVTAGKDRGKTGKVMRTEPEAGPRLRRGPQHRQAPPAPALGQGHPEGGEAGGIIEKEGPIDVSNVMLLDPEDNKPTRVSVERGNDGKRERYRQADRQPDRLSELKLMEAATTDHRQPQQAAPPPRLRERYEQEIVPR